MEERYLRNLGALTERECTLLRTKMVFVAGCGGPLHQAFDRASAGDRTSLCGGSAGHGNGRYILIG